MCLRHCGLDVVRQLEDDSIGYSDKFWEQLAESNVNPYDPSATGDKDTRREQGGRGFGDIPWWTPGK